MNIPYVMKKCTCCGEWKIASTINFYRKKSGKYGLEGQCKECRNKKRKQWRLENKDKIAEYRKANKEKRAEYDKQYYKANKERIDERNKQWNKYNKEKIVKYQKQYYKANKERIDERNKQWYEANREKATEQKKQYYEDNKERITERHKQYYQSPQGQVAIFNGRQRRRTKEQQGTGITKDQWLEMMKFFDWKCAYSGERLTDKTRSVDHIVPLNSEGDNMIWNVVPMLRSLNSSKKAKDMLEWYEEQSFYDPKRLQKIYDWQEYAYNKYGKDSEYFNTNDIQITLL